MVHLSLASWLFTPGGVATPPPSWRCCIDQRPDLGHEPSTFLLERIVPLVGCVGQRERGLSPPVQRSAAAAGPSEAPAATTTAVDAAGGARPAARIGRYGLVVDGSIRPWISAVCSSMRRSKSEFQARATRAPNRRGHSSACTAGDSGVATIEGVVDDVANADRGATATVTAVAAGKVKRESPTPRRGAGPSRPRPWSRVPTACAPRGQDADQVATALAGEDYLAANGSLTFAPRSTSAQIEVVLVADSVDEGPETFTLRLRDPRGAMLSDAAAAGEITDSADPVVPPGVRPSARGGASARAGVAARDRRWTGVPGLRRRGTALCADLSWRPLAGDRCTGGAKRHTTDSVAR